MTQKEFEKMVDGKEVASYGAIKEMLKENSFLSDFGREKMFLHPVPQDWVNDGQRKKRGGYDRWFVRFKEVDLGIGGEGFVDVLSVGGDIVDVLYAGTPDNIGGLKGLALAALETVLVDEVTDEDRLHVLNAFEDRNRQRGVIQLVVETLFHKVGLMLICQDEGMASSKKEDRVVGSYADF